MIHQVTWSAAATRHVVSIYRYLLALNPQAATAVIESIYAAAKGLEMFPHRGRLCSPQMRELVIMYPDVIRYRVRNAEVVILRVRHASRRPTRR